MSGNNKKPMFGTLSVVTIFFVTFLTVSVLIPWTVLTFVFRITGSDNSSFGAGLLIAVVMLPTLIVAAIIAWLVAFTAGRKFHKNVTPDNKTSGNMLWGFAMLPPAWIVGFFVWDSQTTPLAKPKILLPAVTSGVLQLTMLVGLGLLSKSNDKTRRRVWGIILCMAVLLTPLVVAKIAVR